MLNEERNPRGVERPDAGRTPERDPGLRPGSREAVAHRVANCNRHRSHSALGHAIPSNACVRPYAARLAARAARLRATEPLRGSPGTASARAMLTASTLLQVDEDRSPRHQLRRSGLSSTRLAAARGSYCPFIRFAALSARSLSASLPPSHTDFGGGVVPVEGFEPPATRLRSGCSTAELHRPRAVNRRPPARVQGGVGRAGRTQGLGNPAGCPPQAAGTATSWRGPTGSVAGRGWWPQVPPGQTCPTASVPGMPEAV